MIYSKEDNGSPGLYSKETETKGLYQIIKYSNTPLYDTTPYTFQGVFVSTT